MDAKNDTWRLLPETGQTKKALATANELISKEVKVDVDPTLLF